MRDALTGFMLYWKPKWKDQTKFEVAKEMIKMEKTKFERMLKEIGYSDKAISEILKWYGD